MGLKVAVSGPGVGSEQEANGSTFHLTPAEHWAAQKGSDWYAPEGFGEEGFVHCTDGEAALIETANRYYRDDAREFVVLEVDLGRVGARAIYEDEARIYPHIYGEIDIRAVVSVRRTERGDDGSFVGIGEALPGVRE